MLAQAMILYVEELERAGLLRFEDLGTCEFVFEQKVGLKIDLKDVLKDDDLATIWGESSPLYTLFVSIS